MFKHLIEMSKNHKQIAGWYQASMVNGEDILVWSETLSMVDDNLSLSISKYHIPAEHMTSDSNKVISTIKCSAVMLENDELKASDRSGITIPIKGNNAKKRNSTNSFIGDEFIF